jgi:hypothetical protein
MKRYSHKNRFRDRIRFYYQEIKKQLYKTEFNIIKSKFHIKK